MDDQSLLNAEPGKTVLGGKYLVKEKLGSGSFGTIHRALNIETNEIVAIKFERRSLDGSTLTREARILQDIAEAGTGFPQVICSLVEDDMNAMVMTCLGYNLEKLLKTCNYKFSMKTTLMLGDQMLTRIEYLHSKGYLHRDIKPENFVIGLGPQSKTLYLIDFGLAKTWKDHAGKHIPYRENKGLVGTARYASIATHKGIEQSRRDDLEAICYVLIYFLKGRLPWQNLKCSSRSDKYAKITDVKCATTTEALCKDLPLEFVTYLNYVKNLGFSEAPDYKFLKKLLRRFFIERGYEFDYHYDWLVSTSVPGVKNDDESIKQDVLLRWKKDMEKKREEGMKQFAGNNAMKNPKNDFSNAIHPHQNNGETAKYQKVSGNLGGVPNQTGSKIGPLIYPNGGGEGQMPVQMISSQKPMIKITEEPKREKEPKIPIIKSLADPGIDELARLTNKIFKDGDHTPRAQNTTNAMDIDHMKLISMNSPFHEESKVSSSKVLFVSKADWNENPNNPDSSMGKKNDTPRSKDLRFFTGNGNLPQTTPAGAPGNSPNKSTVVMKKSRLANQSNDALNEVITLILIH